jgi:hypothetical protein
MAIGSNSICSIIVILMIEHDGKQIPVAFFSNELKLYTQ